MNAEPSPWMILMKIVEICELQIRSPQEGISGEVSINETSQDMPSTPLSIIQYIKSGGVNIAMGDEYNVNQAGAVGRGAKATGNTFSQNVNPNANFTLLANELEVLRAEMKKDAQTPDEDLAVAEIGQARVQAESGDEEAASSHLARAGRWALDTATSIGTEAAAAAIRASMGL